MELLYSWKIYITIFLVCSTIYNQSYKKITRSLKSSGALIVLLELGAGLFSLLFLPFFKFKLPHNPYVYLSLAIAIIFYALTDRLETEAVKRLEISTYVILRQLSTVFVIILGIIFLKEPLIFTKLLGASLIILSNIILLYEKELKFNKNILYALAAQVSYTCALFLDINYSEEFNLAFYIFLTLVIPAFLIMIFDRVKFNDLILEYQNTHKPYLLITILSWSLQMISLLQAYHFGSITEVAPTAALSVIINVFFSYLILKEKNKLFQKLLGGFLIIIAMFLINI